MISQNHMSGGHGGGGASWKPFLEILGVIAALWILWYFTGGPQRAAQEGALPFMSAPQQFGGNGELYNTHGAAETAPTQ